MVEVAVVLLLQTPQASAVVRRQRDSGRQRARSSRGGSLQVERVVVGEHGGPCPPYKGAAGRRAAEEAAQVVEQLVHEHVPGAVEDGVAEGAAQGAHLGVGELKVEDELVAEE